jgi:hypothetical protein
MIFYSNEVPLVGTIHANRDTLNDGLIFNTFKDISKLCDLSSIKVAFTPYLMPENYFLTEVNLDRKMEWVRNNVVIPYGHGFLFDQGIGAKLDLLDVGIKEKNIFDARVDTWVLSEDNHKKGKSICSWRYWQFLNPNLGFDDFFELLDKRDSRANRAPSYFVIMLKNKEPSIGHEINPSSFFEYFKSLFH